jgi:hypothetical protein
LPAGWNVLLWSAIHNLVFELVTALVVSKSLGDSGGDRTNRGPQGESYVFYNVFSLSLLSPCCGFVSRWFTYLHWVPQVCTLLLI